MQSQPKIEILIFLQNMAYNTHTPQPVHPRLWIVCKAIAHAISINHLVLVVCMLKASSLEQCVWRMERSGLANHDLAIIYSQSTSFPINTGLNTECVWSSSFLFVHKMFPGS